MTVSYGKTWWGQQWLKALTQIDFSNRLPRGKTYANKGAVTDIQLKSGAVDARVQGSRPRPYKVSITIPSFSEGQKKAILDEVQQNPALLAQLLNRELPAELDETARQQGLALFPRTWKDFPMQCSCPDAAVPCKHLAAVIYTIANEIDRNPFVVFQLHGLDLMQALKDRHINVQKGSAIHILTPGDIGQTHPAPPKPLDETIWEILDFSRLEPLKDKLLKLLTPNPVFWDKDFRKTLEKAYGLLVKGAAKYAPGPLELDGFSWQADLLLHLDETLHLRSLSMTNEDGSSHSLPEQDHLAERLRTSLLKGDHRQAEGASDTLRALFWIQQFCLQLLRNGAVVPQLLRVGQDEYRIRWLPATNHPTVRSLFEDVLRIVPANLVEIDTPNEPQYQEPNEQLYTLCSLFLNDYVQSLTEPLGRAVRSWTGRITLEFDWIEDLFFRDQPLSFEGRQMRELPSAIQLWLNNFYITHKTVVPILRVEDNLADGTFTVDILAEDSRQPMRPPLALRKILTQKVYEPVRFDFLQDVQLLTHHFPQLNEVVRTKGAQKARFDAETFVAILLETLPLMQLFGIQVLLPKSLQDWVRPQLSGRLQDTGAEKVGSFLNRDQMLTFDYQVAIGDELIDPQEFRKLVRGVSGLVRIRDRYVLVQADELEKLQKRLEHPPHLSETDLLKIALAEEYQGIPIGISPDVLGWLRTLTQPPAVTLPTGLTAELRPYQQRGYEWLLKNTQLGFGSLLADDMGLGKTLQVITLLLKFREDGRFQKKRGLVVLPTTLLTNWQKELARFAPSLRVLVYHGAKRQLDLTEVDVVLTTYGLVRSDPESFKKQAWYALVIDEAQAIKNTDTEQTRAIKALKADVKIALSGTPVENRLSEFWSVLDFTNKGYLGSLSKFTEEFAKPIQVERNHEKLEAFRKITAPFLLRRVKTDKSVIADLPDKVENNQYCHLTRQQAALYQSVVQESLKAIEGRGGIQRKGLVLKLMTALKQIGNHPVQYTKKGHATPHDSGKVEQLFELLTTIYENGEKVLVFTQYREMGDLLVQFIAEQFPTKPLFLHGGIERNQRDELVERFQTDRHANTFILSLKAGGTGLNLTAASHVIHYDLWWNPAVENQATDRAFRIGQTRNVMVYRLINNGTMEEKIDAMIHAKRELADLSVTTGETWLGDLSNEELKNLVRLED